MAEQSDRIGYVTSDVQKTACLRALGHAVIRTEKFGNQIIFVFPEACREIIHDPNLIVNFNSFYKHLRETKQAVKILETHKETK